MATFPIHQLSAQAVSHAVITSAMKAHTELGPGLLESTYQACLQYELHPAGYSTCQPTDRYRLKSTEIRVESPDR